jgi:hypothetical protein
MSVPSVDHFRDEQRSLIQDVATCYEDLSKLRKASNSSIINSHHTRKQSLKEVTDLTTKLVTLIESADRDFGQANLLKEEGDDTADTALQLTERSKFVATKYHQEFDNIATGFSHLAASSKAAFESAKRLSRDATIFQATRVASIEQRRQTILKNLQAHVSTAKERANVLTTQKSILENQAAVENQRASTSGREASRQDENRDVGITVR